MPKESSLRSKCFQSSYGAKVRKKRGEGKGRRRWNACPQTPRFWKTPLGYLGVRFICKLTARQNRSMTNKLLPRIDRFLKLLCSLIEHIPGDCKNCNKKGLRWKKVKTLSDCCGISCFLLCGFISSETLSKRQKWFVRNNSLRRL